ncbi:hypothetical protein IC582_006204 [Cucumis melo]|nr:UPF0481 protein At3g47200-like [Cucumis melo]KAA0064946.1 UPF0481 protein [Cucumis melo var. makuwa]
MENVDVFEMEMGKHSEIGMHKVEAESVSNNEMPQIIEAQQDLCDNVVISIQKMLNQMHSINGDCSIYRIPKQLREMNPKAYTPQLISIGPFHHYRRQNDFKATEQYKLQALVNFLRRINNNNETMEEDQDVKKSRSLDDLLKIGTLKVLVEKVHCWMTETRNCYSEPIDYMDDHNFVIMMLLDACFIVESFIQQYDASYPHDRKFPRIQDNVDFLLLYPETSQDISNDLIKLENQVPFFLLQHMFHMIPQHSPPVSFINLTYSALYDWFISTYKICSVGIVPNEPKHLVHFLSFYFIPSHTTDDMIQNKQEIKNSENKKKNNYNFLSFFSTLFCCQLWQNPDNKKKNDQELLSPPSITELCESGVTIEKAKNAKYLTNITFKNGVLKIPHLHIYDEFELMFRNLIAFEQFPAGNENMYATQYILFMDDLISTEKDVRLLVNSGVIINNIGGSDKEVSELFNNLGKFVNQCPSPYMFNHISKALRKHCNGRWNKAKASLKHNYFNTPWAFISFFAASFLVLLTLLQTIFSGISAFPS